MSIKKGLRTTLKAVWWMIAVPVPETMKFIWKHKLLSAAAAVGLWWGAGKLKTPTCHAPCQPRITQQAKAKQAQKVVAPTLADMEKAADQAVQKKALVSDGKTDLSAKTGDRALPAVERISNFVELGAKNSAYPEKKGFHSIIICDKTNPQNYAVMHIGFHHKDNHGVGQFKLYHSVVLGEGAKMPQVNRMFNISFDMPGMRMGIEPQGGSLMPTKCNMNVATVKVSKDKGRTLLIVNEQGGLDQVDDQKVVDMAFKELKTDGKAKVFSQDFKLYHDAGAYPNEKPQWQIDLEKQGGR